ncbi:Protein phosphatase 1 regulatory inhibitor subunit 16B [Fragariocoptes setiger]|uniref:Protein phosphatase 1 regulatory inhibitor subunit 16B n=1 Tax=Fragariocoptes setiger TaxID=1670756 RepID=A0ABQ7S7L4_9ACAR|nr:Protein phosphatase 1 regulatory inhibitor subunit 16B [Fragariocoptes setiger]
MDHSELISEFPALEKMGTQERQKLAKRRRLDQIKRWSRAEKELIAKERQQLKKLQQQQYNSNDYSNNGLKLRRYVSRSIDGESHNTKTNNVLTINNNYNNNSTVTKANKSRVRFDTGVTLLEAAARNDIDEVRRLLLTDVSSVNSATADGLTALHQCCIDANEAMSKLLIEFGADVNAKDADQWTPLHAACTCGHLNLVKHLVESGAELLLANSDGNFPYDICEDEATLEYIESEMSKRGITQEQIDHTRSQPERQMLQDLEQIVKSGGSLEVRNEQQATPLHIAAANGYLSVVEFLLDHNVDVNARDADSWAPLHAAACWNPQPMVIEALIKSGAKTDSKTIDGETPVDICEDPEIKELMTKLKNELEAAISEHSASNSLRLRRSQSRTNTRTHSVRRTSIRDKSNLSRREARQEANLRQLPANVTQPSSAPPSNGARDGVSILNDTNANSTTKRNSAGPANNGALTALATQDSSNTTIRTRSNNNNDNNVNSNNLSRVTVTDINVRMAPTYCDTTDNATSATPALKDNRQVSPPPSPSLGLRKYRGAPIEVFGDDSNSICCSIS